MIELGSFRNTVACAVTADAGTFTSPGPHSIYVVIADRNVMIVRNDAPVDASAFLLREGQYARLRLEKNEVLTFALAPGETDGKLYVTECS